MVINSALCRGAQLKHPKANLGSNLNWITSKVEWGIQGAHRGFFKMTSLLASAKAVRLSDLRALFMYWQGVGENESKFLCLVKAKPSALLLPFLWNTSLTSPLLAPHSSLSHYSSHPLYLNPHLTSFKKSAPHQPRQGQVSLPCGKKLTRFLKHSPRVPVTRH